MHFIIILDTSFFLVKSIQGKFKLFYPNNRIVSKPISFVFPNFFKYFNFFNRSLFHLLGSTMKTVLPEANLSSYLTDVLLQTRFEIEQSYKTEILAFAIKSRWQVQDLQISIKVSGRKVFFLAREVLYKLLWGNL
jgi:hypothetical protein